MLSGGEQQMLAVSRAMMARPRLLMMDEPSLGLAPLVVEEIFRIISDLNADGTTIFLVEQNAHMALQVADHFFLLEQGQVTFSGKPGQLSEHEVIQRAYLGKNPQRDPAPQDRGHPDGGLRARAADADGRTSDSGAGRGRWLISSRTASTASCWARPMRCSP